MASPTAVTADPLSLPTLEEALQCVDDMDQALIMLLPPGPDDHLAYQQLQQMGPQAAEPYVQQFSSAATRLQGVLHRFKSQAQGESGGLQEEIRALEQELAAKEQLIQECQRKVQQWQRVCADLKAEQERILFSGFT